MNAVEKLKKFKKEIDCELEKFFDLEEEKAKKISFYCAEIVRVVRDITMRGGKRVRAATMYHSYIAFSGKDLKKAMYCAMSMELMQTYLLIHDDIMDDSDMRRGGPSVHYIYKEIYNKKFSGSKSKEFGNAMAILAGDLAHTFGNNIISSSGFDEKKTSRALFELSKMYEKEYFGQLLDIYSELLDNISERDVFLIHQLKTSPYTFDGPCKIGAILAGAKEKEIKKIENYSIPLGVAFQVQDDILGVFGTEEKIGKPVLSDLQEGKKTLLIIDALNKADEDQAKTLIRLLGKTTTAYSDLERVREIIQDTGALEKSKKIAKEYVNKAIKSLKSINFSNPDGTNFLIEIADYMVDREC